MCLCVCRVNTGSGYVNTLQITVSYRCPTHLQCHMTSRDHTHRPYKQFIKIFVYRNNFFVKRLLNVSKSLPF